MKKFLIGLHLICLYALIYTPAAVADYSLGNDEVLNWHGSIANILTMPDRTSEASEFNHSPYPDDPAIPPDRTHYYGEHKDAVSSAYYEYDEESYFNASINNSPYNLHGEAYSEGTSQAWRAGGFFRDELYFKTADNSPGILEFVFELEGSVEAFDDSAPSSASFTVEGYTYKDSYQWGGDIPIQRDFNWLGNLVYLSDGTTGKVTKSINNNVVEVYDDGLYHDFSETVTFSTSQVWDNNLSNPGAGLVQSDTYLPITFSTWADVVDGEVSWPNSFELIGVNVYDQNENPIDKDNYTLLSTSENFTLFNNEGANVVPIPGALWLLGSGIVGIIGIRRKMK